MTTPLTAPLVALQIADAPSHRDLASLDRRRAEREAATSTAHPAAVLGWSGAELSGTWFNKHDTIRVEATPSDGSDDGAQVNSETVTAVNTPPSATSAELFPASVREDSVPGGGISGDGARTKGVPGGRHRAGWPTV